MLSSTAILTTLTLAGLSLAQSSTISLYIPGADTQPLVGSIIGSVSPSYSVLPLISFSDRLANWTLPRILLLLLMLFNVLLVLMIVIVDSQVVSL